MFYIRCYAFAFSVQKFKIMIKANELRLGNLINIKNKASGIEYKEEVVHGSLIMDLHSNGDNSSFIYTPIEITEELLTRLGFKKWGSYDLWKANADDRRSLTLRSHPLGKENHGCDFELSKNYNVGVKHVHQLQNLYFALTSKELVLSEA